MLLPAYTQKPCVPCTWSKLDLDSMLPLQIGNANDYLVCTSAKSGPESSGPQEFLIPASGDDYPDLSNCYLYLKCRIFKADGSPIETLKSNASVAPMNLLFHSLFRQVNLMMNDTLVATSGDTYHYRAYQMLLLSYGCDAKETWLKHLECWQTDKDGKYDAQENVSLISWRGMIAKTGPLTSRAGCTRTCCCKSDSYQTMWMHGWCCRIADPRFTSWTLGPSQKVMYASRRPSWRYTRSRSGPLHSCAWKRSWPLRGPHTR